MVTQHVTVDAVLVKPVTTRPRHVAREKALHGLEEQLAGSHILLVEDNAINREVATTLVVEMFATLARWVLRTLTPVLASLQALQGGQQKITG